MSNMDKIVFIGLGKMGLPMAENLVASGFKVIGHDLSVPSMNKFSGKTCEDLPEAFSWTDAVITMLPSGQEVQKVLLTDNNFKNLKPGTVLLEMSSSLPKDTLDLKGKMIDWVQILDAPVSGGVIRAKSAQLSIMVGGSKNNFNKALHILEALSATVFYCGPTGTGHAVKALNNYVSAAGLIAACEALIAAKKMGIDETSFVEVLNSSTGKNNTTEKKLHQFILNGSFNSGFALSLMAKDVDIARVEADQKGLNFKLLSEVSNYLNDALENLPSHADHTHIYEFIQAYGLYEN